MRRDDEVIRLCAENATLWEQVTALLACVQQVEAQMAKDSRNSSKQVFSDGLKQSLPQTCSLRLRSGRKLGGNWAIAVRRCILAMEQVDTVVDHRPTVCGACQAALDATEVVTGQEWRQVHDPPLQLHITERQAFPIQCVACHHITVAPFPAGVPSRFQYGSHPQAWVVYLVTQQCVPYARVRGLLGEGYGVRLALGTLFVWVRQAAQALAPVETALKQPLGHAPVLHCDETGVRRRGRLAWAQVTSSPRLTHYAIHAQRGTEATGVGGILPTYAGVSVHVGWKPYQTYIHCRHAPCNVHHPRELTILAEELHHSWAADFKDLLLVLKTAVEAAQANGFAARTEAVRQALHTRYEALLLAGLAAHPPPLEWECASVGGANTPPRATCSNDSGSSRRRHWRS